MAPGEVSRLDSKPQTSTSSLVLHSTAQKLEGSGEVGQRVRVYPPDFCPFSFLLPV